MRSSTVAVPGYVTREELATSLDIKASAYMSAQLDRKTASASRAVESKLNLKNLYPLTTTRYFDWPGTQNAGPSRLYFHDRRLISATTVTSGGVTIPSGAYLLEPNGDGPPYAYLELDRSQSYAFAGLTTPQRAIAITGVWGETNDEDSVTTLASAVVSTSATTVTVTVPAGGVGRLLRIDTERLLITEKSWAVSGQTVLNASGLTASTTDASLTVTDSSVFQIGELLLVDLERLQVREIIDATTLAVARAWDGTTLATHSNGATIRRQLTLTVQRGAAGTTAATHLNGATVYRWQIPALANELALAYAEDALLQGNSGYARTVGSGDAERAASGRGIKDIEARAMASLGRMARTRAV